MGSALFLIVIFVGMYFMTIRPQQARMRAQRALVDSLQPGDEVVTAGGLVGHIRDLDPLEIRLDLGNGMVVRMARHSVTGRLGPADNS